MRTTKKSFDMFTVSPRNLCDMLGSNSFVPSHLNAGIFGLSTFSRKRARMAPAEIIQEKWNSYALNIVIDAKQTIVIFYSCVNCSHVLLWFIHKFEVKK